jgi:UDP-N-acetylmuramate dehydrogenase
MLIEQNISLADKNWFRTGGPAAWYAQPETADDFKTAIAFAQSHALSIFVLGQGANILISDAGFNGLVIHPNMQDIIISSNTVTAGAGVSMEHLIDHCLKNNLSGLEEFSGIPGTVGGSVYINIHYFQFLLSHFLVSARVIHATTGAIKTVDEDWFAFGYDTSTLLAKEYFLLDATFKLALVDAQQAAFARGRSVEIIRHRRQRYPYANTCGSFFRNFHADEVTFETNGKKLCFVAYYLDSLGIKGSLTFGGAAVSHQHANMIVTKQGATSNDVIELVRAMQQRVRNTYGITPQPECQLVGFEEYPLL